ncbi:hypothetical protein Barba19A_gp056 [Rheinheimera phage vB_RspM_Barba19A]|jgi:hypothetical protein|uniref:Uncharacterized protein n=2 Tax=Barbavirus barba19A TaxID=2734091 RepID=A0A4P8NHF2_9CAUD|nr:hypothetical protein HOV47_gp056 [Rheinheimera phage vB_RspM_Barba19A]QCQ61896.1 hypothetical protein Barba19A_gp056 [Rheinheimera phage vB_RspM_Barba19A]QCQ64646.1 hypothetical protein Barba31A_gp056 [Rheinheimera phage vB_RspM_Barba31A]
MFDNENIEALEKEIAALKMQLDLIGKVDQYKASLIHTYHFAGAELLKCNIDRFTGSGLIVTIKSLSGKELVMPFMVKDGLSNTTINTLLDDMQRSFDSGIEFKPVQKRL